MMNPYGTQPYAAYPYAAFDPTTAGFAAAAGAANYWQPANYYAKGAAAAANQAAMGGMMPHPMMYQYPNAMAAGPCPVSASAGHSQAAAAAVAASWQRYPTAGTNMAAQFPGAAAAAANAGSFLPPNYFAAAANPYQFYK